METEYFINIVWFDDQKRVLNASIPSLRQEFKEKYKYDLKFKDYVDYEEFKAHIEENIERTDAIFLDIDFGTLHFNGIEVYREIREMDKNIIIVFVSGHLADPEWETKIEELKYLDSNLNTIKLNFPTRRAVDYYELVSVPVIKIINSKTKIFEFPYYEYLKSKQDRRQKLLGDVDTFNMPFVEKVFHKDSDIEWVVIGKEPGNILKKGNTETSLTSKELIEISVEEGIMVSAYKRNTKNGIINIANDPAVGDYITQKTAKSIDVVIGKILHIDTDFVIVKCLLDENNRIFETRKFNIELFEGSVTLDVNVAIEIEIIIFPGETKFLCRNADPQLLVKFEKRKFFDKKDYSAFFNPQIKSNENYF